MEEKWGLLTHPATMHWLMSMPDTLLPWIYKREHLSALAQGLNLTARCSEDALQESSRLILSQSHFRIVVGTFLQPLCCSCSVVATVSQRQCRIFAMPQSQCRSRSVAVTVSHSVAFTGPYMFRCLVTS